MVAAAALARKRDQRFLIGALSRIISIATRPSPTAPVMYQAGASGEPVTSINQVTMNCAVPPKLAMDRA